MAENLAELKQRREDLQQAIDNAVSDASYEGREWKYRPVDEMQRALVGMDRRIAVLDNTGSVETPSVRVVRIKAVKGL